ncbi:hypothetical protein O181_032483 [Austropuccinia psidii MF-1]|uniref:Integrase catalytic domain-containing protein n=1 Tax=Austropuccinia psidii MF-1 TaxID=1389203 RepID=A0A9Q3CZJ8_9BASI|nr:hypothetical protein [Austropuccinia psidii MF-1]
MIQALEDIIRRFCAYGLEYKDLHGFTHYWCTVIPVLELSYKTSVHSSTGQSPAMLEKGWNPSLPADKLRKYFIFMHFTAFFKIMLYKVKHHATQSMHEAFDYAKQKWYKSHKVPDFILGDLILVSTLNVNNIKGPKKLKDSYVELFLIVSLQGTYEFQVALSGELEKKHPNFPFSFINPYQQAEIELFPLMNPTTLLDHKSSRVKTKR